MRALGVLSVRLVYQVFLLLIDRKITRICMKNCELCMILLLVKSV